MRAREVARYPPCAHPWWRQSMSTTNHNKPEDTQDAAYGKQVIRSEIGALEGVLQQLDAKAFGTAVNAILDCRGRVIVAGIGKAGIIGQKISATLASTGTPSHCVHPIEAVHGDLGRILRDDVVIVLSNSGETEVVCLMPHVRSIGAQIIGITGDPGSTVARHSDVVICIGTIQEACPLGLAPSASTTAMLAIGDALALTVAHRRSFNKEDYALYHPGGELGRKLLPVERAMRTGDACCSVCEASTVREALRAIARAEGRAGAISIVDENRVLVGIFTDGDLRRKLESDTAFLDRPISEVMTREPKRITAGMFAAEAARILRDHRIDELPVVDEEGKLVGIIDVQDLLETRLIH